MATSLLLALKGIVLTFGGQPLLDDAELVVSAGDAIALVGRNGSGKSNLLRVAAGLVEPDRGDRVVTHGRSIRYLPQEPDLSGFGATLDYVVDGLGPEGGAHRARQLLEALGFRGDEDPAKLSGGEIRRCALARVLAPEPDVLLLDEPTNHLDLPAIEWLEGELARMRSALVVVSHDRRLLGRISTATVWLDRGRTRRLTRGFDAFEAWRDTLLEQEEVARHKLDRKIAAEEDWVRYGVSARRKRNQKRLRDLGTLRIARVEQQRAPGSVKFTLGEDEASSRLVIEARRVTKAWGAQTVVRDLSMRVMAGDRVGIIGPNGAGKTTILNLLTGSVAPDTGFVRHGVNLQMVTLDQKRAALDPAATLQESLTGGRGDIVQVGGVNKHVVTYMRDFLFRPEQARMPVGVLSGGERGRLMLARALAQPSNLLILDEPTNDLDLETLDLLQEMLNEYAGTALLVSHDRDFLDRVVTSVLAFEGDGRWVEYAGGYSDMVVQRGHGVLAKQPQGPPPSGSKSAVPALPKKGPAAPKGRLSFHERHALKILPQRIATLQAKAGELGAVLADPGLFGRDETAFTAAATALDTARTELSKAEDEWLALEMRREELGVPPD